MADKIKKKRGRPKKAPKIPETAAQFIYQLASLHCPMEEIAALTEVHVDTLRDNYSKVIEKGRSDGKKRLRRAQIHYALKGNATLLIWLGKQMLNQKETPEDAEESAFKPEVTYKAQWGGTQEVTDSQES